MKKYFFNIAVAILLYVLTFPLVYIILTAVFGGEDSQKIECLTMVLGTVLGSLLSCTYFTSSLGK
jgi:ABC-type transport system involved in cytochrome c biogenesis permease component